MEVRVNSIKPDVASGKLVGYAAVFDSPSDVISEKGKRFTETVAPGAFARSLASGRDVVALWDHSTSRPPLGRLSAGTLRLSEDGRGLRVEIDPPKWAGDIVESVGRGDVTGMSFTAGIAKGAEAWSYAGGMARRRLSALDLVEVSLVTHPAYTGTSVAVRNKSAVEVPDLAALALRAAARARQLARLR